MGLRSCLKPALGREDEPALDDCAICTADVLLLIRPCRVYVIVTGRLGSSDVRVKYSVNPHVTDMC